MSADFNFDMYLAMDPSNPIFQRDVSYVGDVLNIYRDNEWISHERYRDLAVRLQLHGQPSNNYIGKAFRLFDSIHYNGFDRLNWDNLSFKGVLDARIFCNQYGQWLNTHRPMLNNPETVQYIYALARKFKEEAEAKEESKWGSLKELQTVIITAMLQGVITKDPIEPAIKLLIAGMVMYYQVWEQYPRQHDPRAVKTENMDLFAGGNENVKTNGELSYARRYAIEMFKDFLLGEDNFAKVFSRWQNALRDLKESQAWSLEKLETEIRLFRLATVVPNYKIPMRDVILEFARMVQSGQKPYVHIFNKEHLYNALNYANKFMVTFTDRNLVDELVVRFIDDPMRGLVDKGRNAESLSVLQRNLTLLREYQLISPLKYEEYLDRGRAVFK